MAKSNMLESRERTITGSEGSGERNRTRPRKQWQEAQRNTKQNRDVTVELRQREMSERSLGGEKNDES